MIPSAEMTDPKPTSENRTSSEENRRTIGKWFRTLTTHNRTPRQTPSEAPLQTGIPSQTKATPPTEKPSTMAPGKRQQVSLHSSIDTGHGYLTTGLSGRLEGPLSGDRFVLASYSFMNTITYRASQKKTAPKATASNQPPKPASHSEAGPANVPDETKAGPSGAQNDVEVRVHSARLVAGTHNNSCSQVNRPGQLRAQKLVPSMFPTKRLVRITTWR